MKQTFTLSLITALMWLAAMAPAQSIFPGDGSDTPGFVPPPQQPKMPPPPPRSASSAETFIPFPGPPVVPQSRSEAKKPPRPPVMFTKLKTDHLLDWAATPNDLNNLMKKMKSMVSVDYVMEIKTLGEVDPNPESNPILFRSGHYRFEFSQGEREKLRKYMMDGGMLVLNTGLGSQPFYDSAVKELAPIFHSYYDMDRVRYRPGVYKSGFKGNEPWFDGITINCRTMAVISRWCMAVGWEENENDDYQAYESEDAHKIGANLFAYSTAQRAWAKQSAGAMKFVDSDDRSTDRMSMVQVIYDGEWKTRHVGLSVLLQSFNAKTDVPVKFGLKEMRLSDPAIFDAPLLYITGHENFRLRRDEATTLREYLLNGGFLFAEACCGRKGFDLAFKNQMQQILPEYPFVKVGSTAGLLNLPNPIKQVTVTPALAAHLGTATPAPLLEAIEIDGHVAVIYSPFGLAGGWEMSQNPYAHGLDDSSAIQLGQNILMYAVTQ